MKELIGIAMLIAALYGGTPMAKRVYGMTQVAALTKSAHGLPKLAPFAAALTARRR